MPRPKHYKSKLDPYRDKIIRLYQVKQYSTTRVAKVLGINQKTLYNWLKREGFIRNRSLAAYCRPEPTKPTKSYSFKKGFLLLISNVDSDLKRTNDPDFVIAERHNCLPEFVKRQRKFIEI